MPREIDLPQSSQLVCPDVRIGEDVQLGPDVRIECERLRLGDGVRIGCTTDADFRAQAGVRIRVQELVLGDGVTIGRCVHIRGGHIVLERGVRIQDWNDINVRRTLRIGVRGTIHGHCEISGLHVEIGRELWMLPYAKIGGGSAFEVHSSLRAGHFLHIGVHAFINTARPVTLGDEVGLGTRTALYTHGAYPSELRGGPVAFGEIRIGDRAWLPGATVNPGVSIGHDCVIGVGSVVTRDIPAGALAAGTPCQVIRENAYPRELSPQERLETLRGFLRDLAAIFTDNNLVQFDEAALEIILNGDTRLVYRETLEPSALADLRQREDARRIVLTYGPFPCPPGAQETFMDLRNRRVEGLACPISERVLDQLRRYGTRFRFEALDGRYQSWDA